MITPNPNAVKEKMEQLAACPFCGSNNVISHEKELVYCADCPAKLDLSTEIESNAVKVWNTRAPSPDLTALRLKANSSLANNLCPDHRDKQRGKPCLACEIETLRQQNKELVEALKPFADMAEKFKYSSRNFPDNTKLHEDETVVEHNFITLGDCRKASAALSKLKP